MIKPEVIAILSLERSYQDDKWGGPEHDKNHSVAHWIIWMEDYLEKAKVATYEGDEAALHEIRKMTAMGIACMEVHGAPRRLY